MISVTRAPADAGGGAEQLRGVGVRNCNGSQLAPR